MASRQLTGWHIRSVSDMQIALDDNYLTSDQLNVIYSRRQGGISGGAFLITPVIRQKILDAPVDY